MKKLLGLLLFGVFSARGMYTVPAKRAVAAAKGFALRQAPIVSASYYNTNQSRFFLESVVEVVNSGVDALNSTDFSTDAFTDLFGGKKEVTTPWKDYAVGAAGVFGASGLGIKVHSAWQAQKTLWEQERQKEKLSAWRRAAQARAKESGHRAKQKIKEQEEFRRRAYRERQEQNKRNAEQERQRQRAKQEYQKKEQSSSRSYSSSQLDLAYTVLGLNKTCTKQEIKARYLELAKKHHPDVSGYDSSQDMAKISNAYEELLKKYK